MVNLRSRKFLAVPCNRARRHSFSLHVHQEWRGTMRKLAYALAALATVAIGAPTVASAQGFGVYVGGDRGYHGDRYYGGPSVRIYGHDRGYHRGWYHRDRGYGDRDVVIRRHYWD